MILDNETPLMKETRVAVCELLGKLAMTAQNRGKAEDDLNQIVCGAIQAVVGACVCLPSDEPDKEKAKGQALKWGLDNFLLACKQFGGEAVEIHYVDATTGQERPLGPEPESEDFHN